MVKYLFVILVFASTTWAQQLVIPKELDSRQAHLFEKIAQAVSTPCCKNGIPVAFHESGMSLHVRDLIAQDLLAGKSEDEIMAGLAELKLGPNQEALIFTVPENNSLGMLAWATPPLVILLGALSIFFFLERQKRNRQPPPSDEELIERYREFIMKKAAALD